MKQLKVITKDGSKWLRPKPGTIGGPNLIYTVPSGEDLPYIGSRPDGTTVDESEVREVRQYNVTGTWISHPFMEESHKHMGCESRIAYTDAESHDEKWKDIPRYEGYYQISNMGRVKSIERIVDAGNRKYKVQEKILTNQEAVNKHFVRLTVNGISESIMIEKTVKELFGKVSHDTSNDNPRYPLFSHMSSEHGLTLLDSELDEIARHASPMTGVDYWKRRCKVAESMIGMCPSDPKTYDEFCRLYDEWEQIIEEGRAYGN